MNININRDFLHEYKDNAWRGFTAKEIASIAVGAGIAITVAFLVYNFAKIPMAACMYIAIPFAVVPILIGFYKYQGEMGIIELIRAMRYTRKCQTITFEGEDLESESVFSMEENE